LRQSNSEINRFQRRERNQCGNYFQHYLSFSINGHSYSEKRYAKSLERSRMAARPANFIIFRSNIRDPKTVYFRRQIR
jgi:hypothetical protein